VRGQVHLLGEESCLGQMKVDERLHVFTLAGQVEQHSSVKRPFFS